MQGHSPFHDLKGQHVFTEVMLRLCVCLGESQADQAEKRLVSSADRETRWRINVSSDLVCLSLQSVRLAAGFQAAFGAGGEAEFQFSAAGGGGRGAEEEG